MPNTPLRHVALVVLSAAAASLVDGVAHAQFPHLVKDVNPGPGGSYGSGGFSDWNGRAVFRASTASLGIELWISDGTSAGTTVLKDINPGAASSDPVDAGVELNGWRYFRANDGVNGSELWRSDGTSAGTTLFFDFEPGAGSSNPTIVQFGGQLVVAATTAAHGHELWTSDGTVAGTQLLQDILPGAGSAIPSSPFLRTCLGRLWFAADDGVHGRELWSTDGTPQGTAMLADVQVGAGASAPTRPTEIAGGRVVFLANDGVVGSEPWVSDGSALGTSLLLDVHPGPNSSNAYVFVDGLSGGALLLASTPDHGREPWFSDGTTAGTVELADLNPGPGDGALSINSTRVISTGAAAGAGTSPATGTEIWITDGTPAGTALVDLQPGAANGISAVTIGVSGGRGYFYASSSVGPEIAWTDGTVVGTQLSGDLVGLPVNGVGSFDPIEDFVLVPFTTASASYLAYSRGDAETTQIVQAALGQHFAGWTYYAARIGSRIFLYFSPGAAAGNTELWAIDVDGDGAIEWFDDFNVELDCFCTPAVAPCGNADPLAGCANSMGLGASLSGSGSTHVGDDDLVLATTQLPAFANGLMFMGTSAVNPTPFLDGVRCVGGATARWSVKNAGASGTFVYGPGLAALAASSLPLAFQLEPGATWRFQTWYRNALGPCATGSNLSNSATVVFTP